jgi:hypothetical protein
MKEIQQFSLEKHEGPYEKWPSRTRLFENEKEIGIRVPGYNLLHQFELKEYYLLITDDDCPFEEGTNFILISKAKKILAYQILFVRYGSVTLESVKWIDEQHLRVVFYENDHWMLTIRPWGIPYLRSRLKLKRIS